MKVLLILPSFPYPADNGYRIKTFNLIKILRRFFQIELMVLRLKEEEIDDSYLRNNDIPYNVFTIGMAEKIANLTGAIFTKIPFQSAIYKCSRARKELKDKIRDYDYIVCSMVRTGCYVDLIPKDKLIVDMVDMLSKSYSRSISNTTSSFYRLVYKLEVGRLAYMEKYIAEKSHHVLLVNKEETWHLNKYNHNVKWIPNGVNNKLFDYDNIDVGYSDDIVFIGTMDYQPNVDAILWLDKYVLDHLNEQIRLIIIGRNPAKLILEIQKKRKNVLIMGFLEDPYIIVKSCLAVVAPMQNGGGIQNKLLESMAMGTINVVSSYAAKPIVGAENGKHFIVNDDPEQFASTVNSIFKNRIKYESFKVHSKELIINNYTWEQYASALIPIFKQK